MSEKKIKELHKDISQIINDKIPLPDFLIQNDDGKKTFATEIRYQRNIKINAIIEGVIEDYFDRISDAKLSIIREEKLGYIKTIDTTLKTILNEENPNKFILKHTGYSSVCEMEYPCYICEIDENKIEFDDYTPFGYALSKLEGEEVISYLNLLIKKRADVNTNCHNFKPPLFVMVYHDNLNIHTTRFLLEHGANPNLSIHTDYGGDHRTLYGDILQYLDFYKDMYAEYNERDWSDNVDFLVNYPKIIHSRLEFLTELLKFGGTPDQEFLNDKGNIFANYTKKFIKKRDKILNQVLLLPKRVKEIIFSYYLFPKIN